MVVFGLAGILVQLMVPLALACGKILVGVGLFCLAIFYMKLVTG